MQWEYTIVEFKADELGYSETLNAYGEDDWELVTVLPAQTFTAGPNTSITRYRAVLKRPRPE
jgi:hypothetical protein